ncbi:MAG: glycine-rich domain-containing protein [Kiritimatiellia bacterium]
MKKALSTVGFAAVALAVVSLPSRSARADYVVIDAAAAARLPGGQGGDEIRRVDNGDGTCDVIHIFTNTAASAVFSIPDDNKILEGSLQFLIVGGGGAGSGNCGGGGGAGGLVYCEGLDPEAGDYDVTVGAGGAKSTGNGYGNSGSNTTFAFGGTTYTALGGGVGGLWQNQAGTAGGSGGGASGSAAVGAATQPDSNSGGYGNAGGAGASNNVGGGGGGAGGAGMAASGQTGGAGGAGLEFDISGESRFYAGGGGGAGIGGAGNAGGSSVGGAGTSGGTGQTGGAGQDGTGSGGGGAAGGGGTSYGGAGGSGTVIVRYTVPVPIYIPMESGEIVAYGAATNWVDGELVLKYTDPYGLSELTLPGVVKAWVLAVGGGGAGANPGAAGATVGGAGGGGAGGFVENKSMLLQGGVYALTVGAGGLSPSGQGNGGNGQDTVVSCAGVVVTNAVGGGGGGFKSAGCDGGSGGGASNTGTAGTTAKGGEATDGQGFAGGQSYHQGTSTGQVNTRRSGAGGGGAGGVGADTANNNVGASGGPGKESEISGERTIYAAGGGGGSHSGTGGDGGSNGVGGSGGGGPSTGPIPATAGRSGTGSGGGGGCRYSQFGGAGGSGIVIIRIRKMMPVKPPVYTEVGWSGEEIVVYEGSEKVVITKEGTVVDKVAATAAGTHTFTVAPAEGYVWSDGTSDPQTVTLVINKAQLSVRSFTLEGWQVNEKNNEPVLVVVDVNGNPVTLANVTYTWRAVSGTTWANWADEKPATAGEYEIKATFEGTADFDAPDEMPTTTFTLWNGRVASVEGLGWSTDFTLAGGDGNVVIVEVSEALVKGFRYDQAKADGSDVRFTDATGTILPMKLGGWNKDGCSWFYVEVPDNTAGATLTMYWGQVCAADGTPIEPPAAPALTDDELIYHFAFDGNLTNTGSGDPKQLADEGTATYTETGFTADDQAMTGWSGYSRTALTVPAAYSVACVAKMDPTSHGDEHNIVWSLGSYAGGGLALAANPSGSVRVIDWPENNAGPVVSVAIQTTVADLVTAFHRYRLDVNGTAIELFIDGISVGTGTLSTARTSVQAQFAGVYGNVPAGYWKGTGYVMADWTVSHLANASASGGPVYLTPYAIFQNRWLVEPAAGAMDWGTGEEPAMNLGKPAYGESYFVITAVGGQAWTNDFPSVAGAYTLVFRADAGTMRPDGTWGWTDLATDPIPVNVTAHSPRTDLAGTAGSATLSGRVLLANNEPGTVAPIRDQDYYQTAVSSPAIYWEHTGDNPPSYFENLLAGSEHVLVAGAPVDELCGATNIWRLSDVFIGTTHSTKWSESEMARRNLLPFSTTSATQLSDARHLVMRNVENAAILSPCYTNGIGTLYFDAVNGWTTAAGTGYNLKVEVVTGADALADVVDEAAWSPVEMRPLLRDAVAGSGFVAQPATAELALGITNGGNSVDSFYRVVVPLERHEPVRFRIRRTSVPAGTSFAPDGGGFILLDNLVVSYPAMRADLSSFGWYDARKSDKQTLGYENAWNVPFPALGDTLNPRAQATFYTNPGDTNANPAAFITAANFHYRWRYLNQQVNVWAAVALDPDSLTAPDALGIRNAAGEVLPGDVEFWYDLKINAPYYKYVDYAAVDGFRMGDFHSEEISAVTNRRDSAEGALASCGTDWFVRLREGQSDYEGLDVVLSGPVFGSVTNRIAMELVGNHIWRGYLKTPTNATGMAAYRIEAHNLQVPGSTNFAENVAYWFNGDSSATLPVSGTLKTNGDETSWADLPIDAATGYLLFQVDDTTHSITIVHADYQNFREWTDAHTTDGTFKSSSTDDSGLTGTSPRKTTYTQGFDRWQPMPATDPDHWSESFIPSATAVSSLGYDLYTTYASITTPNGWTAGQGMYIYGNYRDPQNDATDRPNIALQMEGQGRGFMQFLDAANAPRGIESIRYTARIGQFIDFGDFSYYDGGNKLSLKDYTLTARVAYDTKNNTDFSGNASLSLVAYYLPGVGCYEFRIEQRKAKRNDTTKAVTGIDRKSQLLSLYKWVIDADTGKIAKTLLGSMEYTAKDIPNTSGMTGNFWPVYFSVSNGVSSTFLTAGVRRDDTGLAYNSGYSNNDGAYYSIGYQDTKSDRLTCGTYGVVSANCPGVFQTPFLASQPVGFLGGTLKENELMDWSDKTLSFPTATRTLCLNDLYERLWVVTPGRMQSYYATVTNGSGVVSVQDDFKWGLRARTPAPQKLVVSLSDPGKDNWGARGAITNTVSSFGTSTQSGTSYTVDFFSARDCSVKIAPLSDVTDVRVDIVIDDLEVRQFRGDDSYNLSSAIIPRDEWENNLNYDSWGKTNFLFTSAWTTNIVTGTTTNGMVLLSAKRTLADHVCSIRTPLMDGSYGRGSGLGVLSFAYRNAQANAKLLVQIATNDQVGAATIAYETPRWDTPGYWTTVTNIDFSAMSETARRQGLVSCYFGLHGVDGVARLVVDPEVVAAVSGVTDRTRFGEVFIDSVAMRDEPNIDARSWTGWNLRTVGDATDSEKFMYLPDYNLGSPEAEPAVGLSAALNSSVTDGVPAEDRETARQHLPYVATPVFVSNDVGSVTFRARRYDLSTTQPAAVVLFGSRTGAIDGTWTQLGDPFIISNATYTTYSYTTDPGQSWKAFRLAVRGVEGVTGAGDVVPEGYSSPVRVLLDEIFVSEAVRPRVGFRNVGAFRGVAPASLNDTAFVRDVPSEKEQPLCNESWGVQCEVYAAQLPDEIDFSIDPQVRLYWFAGDYPWGFETWKTNRNCKSAMLVRATDTNLVYRSSYISAPDTVVPPFTAPGQVVQYALEVVYYQVGMAQPITNTLSAVDWQTPDWYRPVDLNRADPEGRFSAYTILDTVAPHWAWINEVNIFGQYDDSDLDNSDRDLQFVEVAVPAEANIAGWRVEFVTPGSRGTVITNTLGIFDSGDLAPTKPNLIGMASNMVFRVLANKGAMTSGNLKVADGTLDAVWKVPNPIHELSTAGEIDATTPFGLRLVRGSGIVEHEIVCRGMDWFSQFGEDLALSYSLSNTVNELNAAMPGSDFLAVGDDDGGLDFSRGVFQARGGTTNDWSDTMVHTPGRINEGQVIDPDHPTPNGSSMYVYCNLDTAFGHITQTVGDAVNTNGNLILVIRKGLSAGTNITYRVDPWFTIGTVTTNGRAAVAHPVAGEARTFRVNVAANASNNVTVVAAAQVNENLLANGLTADNRYRPAVLDWLSKRQNAYGAAWANPDAEEVRLADLMTLSGTVITNLTLTEMYWLDMDPTAGDLALKVGMSEPAGPVLVQGYDDEFTTNVRMRVFMMITNRTEGTAWAPYILRGMGVGETSWDYNPQSPTQQAWTSETFKITGILANGLTSVQNSRNWIPLRWFVFDEDSFARPDEDKPFTSLIEVTDPYSLASPGGSAGWHDWVQEHGYTPVFFSWRIDEKVRLSTIEILKKTNIYE